MPRLPVLLVIASLAACGGPAKTAPIAVSKKLTLPKYATDADFEREVVARYSAVRLPSPAGAPVKNVSGSFGPGNQWMVERDAQPNRGPLIWDLMNPSRPALLVPDEEHSPRMAQVVYVDDLIIWSRWRRTGKPAHVEAYRVDFEGRKLSKIWDTMQPAEPRLFGKVLVFLDPSTKKLTFFRYQNGRITKLDGEPPVGWNDKTSEPPPFGLSAGDIDATVERYKNVHRRSVEAKRWLILKHYDDSLTVVDLKPEGHEALRVPADYGFISHYEVIGERLYLMGDGKIHSVPLVPSTAPTTARIGDDVVLWRKAVPKAES